MEIMVTVICKNSYLIPVEVESKDDEDEVIKAAYYKYCELEGKKELNDYFYDSDLEYEVD